MTEKTRGRMLAFRKTRGLGDMPATLSSHAFSPERKLFGPQMICTTIGDDRLGSRRHDVASQWDLLVCESEKVFFINNEKQRRLLQENNSGVPHQL